VVRKGVSSNLTVVKHLFVSAPAVYSFGLLERTLMGVMIYAKEVARHDTGLLSVPSAAKKKR
jgi:hypothetical protein